MFDAQQPPVAPAAKPYSPHSRTLANWMAKPILPKTFPNYDKNDLIWTTLVVLAGADLYGKLSNHNWAEQYGLGFGLTATQMTAIDAVLLGRAALQLWVESPQLKAMVTTFAEIAAITTLALVMSKPGNKAFIANAADWSVTPSCSFVNPKMGKLNTAERQWCVNQIKAGDRSSKTLRNCGCD